MRRSLTEKHNVLIECTYSNGETRTVEKTNWMLKYGAGRPVKVVVHGHTSPADRNAIKNSAAMSAEIIYRGD